MRILDLRHAARRVWRGDARADRPPRWWERAVGGAIDAAQAWRVRRRPRPPVRPFVVAIGNLALGGTGKTPVTVALARALAAAGHRGCVLTRGYGSRLDGPLVVDPAAPGAGDEARMMAAMLAAGDWPVVQSRRRRAGLAWVRRELSDREVVLLEDGFQTRLGRHLDVLIVDAWSETDAGLVARTGPVVPFGPWRETARGAARADVLLVEAEGPPARAADGRPVCGFARRLRLPATFAGGGSWAALSGVARPDRFEAEATAALGRAPDLAIRCDDHAAYGPRLRARITAALRAAGRPRTLTTRKDWTKLAVAWPEDLPVAVADQTLAWTGTPTLPELVGERLRIGGADPSPGSGRT